MSKQIDSHFSSSFQAMRVMRKRTTRGFSLALIGSVVLHAAGVGAAVYSSRGHKAPRIENAIPVQIVKLGKKRDPKLLPRKVEEVAPPPPPEEAVKLDSGDKQKPVEKETEKKPTSKEPEMSAAAKRLLDERKLERALQKIDEQEGDPEGDIHGTTTDATNAATGYQRDVGRVLQASYAVPEAIPASQRQFLKARVVLFIEKNGRISNYEFTEKHPNGLFMGALERLLNNITLPPPPAELAKQVKEDGIEILFHL
jgi:type IV secretory pathway VirB10-like protein